MCKKYRFFFDIELLKDMFFPSKCCNCGDLVDMPGLCPTCWSKMSWINEPKCAICSHPFSVEIMPVCPQCLSDRPHFDKAVSALAYDDSSKKMILEFKNADATYLVEQFAKLMYKAAALDIESSDIIIPVPIHFFKRLKRKYNQSELLAKYLSKVSGVEYEPRILNKIKQTSPQEGLSGAERRKNVQGSFGINKRYQDLLENKNVLLVDDVFTTGSTVNECAKILKEHGAKKVKVVTLARVVFMR